MTQSRTLARLLVVLGAIAAVMALSATAASATEPAPGYEQFAGCPTPEENAELTACIRSDITGGHLQTGSKTVPIENPLTISGGVNELLEGFDYNSQGGLSKVKQKVPGGVIGWTGLTWLLEFFGSDALTLYAETELAGTPSNFDFSSVTIPIKVHLINTAGILGNNCYLGSDSNPIVLNLITGTTEPPPPNEPISGVEPEFGGNEELEILELTNGTYVDNSFAVPGASGCVLHLFGFIPISVNGLVNEQADLPSPAGNNEAVQDFNLELTARANVYP